MKKDLFSTDHEPALRGDRTPALRPDPAEETIGMSEAARHSLARWRWPVCTALHVGCALLASFGLRKSWLAQLADGKPATLGPATPLLTAAIVIHGLYNFLATFFLDGLFTGLQEALNAAPSG